MAEEKQFEASQSRVERAKREGDVARSQEIGSVAAFGTALIAASAVVPALGQAAQRLMVAAAAGRTDTAALSSAAVLMLVPIASAAAASLCANIVQSGGLRLAAVSIKSERLAPAENLKRMFSREAVITAARATIAFACAGGAIVPAFAGIYASALHAGGLGALASAAWNGAMRTAAVACVVGAVFSGADYGVQLVRWRKRLRMSFDELKRDQKENDGDPLARGRRRALHRQISRGSLRRVKDAAFVLTNPTHIAIALDYRPPQVPVPRVLVRAADDAAARVRELAGAYGVPLVENVPLARRLYARAQPGDFIPQETYLAVAEVVAALAKAGVLAR
ncbi:MAG TPA: EscU/YscU/HrcU family type III secretion system export apparatus switch protein [Candidatus Baltobacteraceae bacterium]|nr:EscU/YscU/HrcU family type III secretion system export apparatus switch protein [Candidatus Baltobacteraceae bacterium]